MSFPNEVSRSVSLIYQGQRRKSDRLVCEEFDGFCGAAGVEFTP